MLTLPKKVRNRMIRHNGYIWKVQRIPQESEEMAQDRAWYMARTMKPSTPRAEKEALSRQWANEKYYQMKYSGDASKSD
jgi:hypothetical protein